MIVRVCLHDKGLCLCIGAAGKENGVQVTLILGECLANKARLNVLPSSRLYGCTTGMYTGLFFFQGGWGGGGTFK